MANRTITITVPHRLTQQQARERLESGIADLRTKHSGKLASVQEEWNGNQLDFRLAAMGQSVTGRLDVLPNAVKIDVDLPWLLAAFAEKFRPQVEAEAKKMLEKK